ncbi:MAG: lipoprotein [Steroidobacteraceae bacterium]
MQSKFVVILIAISLFGSACGLKGPLYRPEERQQPVATGAAESDKLKRPRPAPQVQKEDQPSTPTDTSVPASPADPERAPASTEPVQSMPADETR